MDSYQVHVYSLDECSQQHLQFLAEMPGLHFLCETRNLWIYARKWGYWCVL